MTLTEERWETIQEFPDYMISSESRVMRKDSLKFIAVCLNKRFNYRYVRLHRNGKSKLRPLYRIKAIAFISNPLNKREVNHIDGNRMNEDLSNLEWTTPSENMKHSFVNGLSKGNFKKGFAHALCKLKEDDIELIRRFRKDKLLSIYKLAKVFGVDHCTISRVAVGRAGNYV